MILIKNGRMIDPSQNKDEISDILIDNGRITDIQKDIKNVPDGCEVIDATGCIVAPGFMDGHVHFRDPGFTHKEDIETGAAAAKKGGYTTVVCMANTKPVIDNTDTLDYVIEKGKKTGIHILSAATVTAGMQGKELVDMPALATKGAVVFTDDGLPILDEAVLKNAMLTAKALDIPISLHEEDPSYINSPGVNKGKVSEKLGYGGADRLAEEVMVERDCKLAYETGAKLCIQHISSAGSVDIVRSYKAKGADVHAEATPHHFSLTEEAVLTHGTNAKMNPPLRTEADRQAIIKGLADGTIDMIATDHAPHSKDEKSRPLIEAPSGIIGLETAFSLAVQNLVKPGHMTLTDVIRCMTVNLADFYGLEFWSISEGSTADLVIFDPDSEWTVTDFASKASNSPFVGITLPAKIRYTIANGNIVYR